MKKLYICDRKACDICSFPICWQTTNRKHSVTFKLKRSRNILAILLVISWVGFLTTALCTMDIWRFF